MFGFLIVDKPSGMTSHDVVQRVRRGTGVRAIGHAGTLDPMATGVLVLCLGDATRLSEYVMASEKVYEATLRLGIETDTYDADGRIVAEAHIDHLTRADFEAALPRFVGTIAQVPPMYSAIKQGGVALYKLARAGQEVERAPRTVTITAIDLIDWAPPSASIRITCGAGTYIRSLAHDLGAWLGVGAHLTALRRTRSGNLDQPIGWAALEGAMAAGDWSQYLIDEKLPLAALPALHLDSVAITAIGHGQSIPHAALEAGARYRLCDPAGRLFAIAETRGDRLQPVKVFHGAPPSDP
jgi:tRNA pseudouridine55 synthase